MAGNFDVYGNWLGIPPKEQPPNFYRLLGIDLFESDPEVIAEAAEQRIQHIRDFQRGEYALLAQKLQKKIISVRDYLLDEGKKTEYDISLKLQLQHKPAPAAPQRPAQAQYAKPSPAAPPVQAVQTYQLKSKPVRPVPAPSPNRDTEYSTNPVVIIKETIGWFREHKKVTATIIKLGYLTIAAVILIIVVANFQNLMALIVGKSSELIQSVSSGPEGKPPDRVERKGRAIPGRTGNPANSTPDSTTAEGTAPAPVPSGDAPPAPPPTEPSTEKTASTETAPPADRAATSTAPPAEVETADLPSGKVFKARAFKVELSAISDLLKEPGKDDPVLWMYTPFGQISALASHNKGVPNGITIAFYEDRKPKTYVVYADGALDGMLKLWSEKGERVYWCQYEKGARNGFCCYFKDNVMQLILEIDHDAITGIHLCANGGVKKSYSSTEQASADKAAQKLLDEVDGLETEIKLNEGLFKKEVKDELQRSRAEQRGMTSQRRSAIKDARVLQSQFLIKALRNCSSL
jgi:antitoxin component YwqK of YwqJK toxin-antitoxin module